MRAEDIKKLYDLSNYDSRTKKIAIIDTETWGITEPRIYDFGILIADFKGNVIHKEQFVIDEAYQSKKMQTAFYANKMPIYDERIAKNELKVDKFWNVSRLVNEILKDFNVKTIGAYNLPFDEKAMEFSTRQYRYLDEFIKKAHQYQRVDLWTVACEHIGTKPEFWQFCIENGFYTKAKNLKTNAEVMYSFITKNPSYEELHLSIDDCEIEYAILNYILNEMQGKSKVKKSDILNNVKHMPYRLTNFDKSLII